MPASECPHTTVIKTVGRHASGPYRGIQFDMWNCELCMHDFFPRHKSRFKKWREVRRMKRDLRGWNAES
jgi:hypothetical protein